MTTKTRKLMVPVLVALFAQVLMAQQAPNMALVRKNPSLSALDQQNIDKWIEEGTAKLFNSADPNADGPPFRAQIVEHVNAADATPGFKDQVAKSLAASLTKHYTPQAQPLAVVFSMTVLDGLGSTAGYDISRKALSDQAPAVRVAGACGLLNIRPKLNTQQAADLLKDVQKAAETEASPVALYRMYRLIEQDNTAPALAALLQVLDARLRRFQEKGELPAWADAQAAEILGARAQAAATPAPRKVELLGYVARLMAYAAHAYAGGSMPATWKESLERVIESAERNLTDATAKMAAGKPQPAIMKNLSAPEKVRAELVKWIGSPEAAGYLNDAPFSMPRSLNIRWAAPTTSTAPATVTSR